MCGIIGYTGARDASPILLEGLYRLEYRGYDSAGVAILDPTRTPITVTARALGKIRALDEKLTKEPISGVSGIGHTRWATHGAPSEDNAHPQRSGPICVVHNGIIENHQSLREEVIASGRTFASQTDTEVLAHQIAMHYEASGDLHQAVREAVGKAVGAWGLVVMADDRPGELIAARRASPLLIGLGGKGRGERDGAAENFVASDVSAMLAHTRVVVDLEDGDTAHITPDSITVRDESGASVRRPRRTINWTPQAAEKQGFKHYMLKEIHEQPRAIRDTMGSYLDEDGRIDPNRFELPLGPNGRMILLACGTSWHAALTGKYLIEQLARVPVEVDLASEYRYRDPIVREGDVVLAISQSGETADTLAALREAARLGAYPAAICNVVDSSIARASKSVFYTEAGPEISVASTKAFTTQLTALYCLAVAVAHQRGAIDGERLTELSDNLRALPVAVDAVLLADGPIKTVAKRVAQARDVLYLGRGLSFPVALEGALKLKEISYLHAEGYASGEMKHGPIALIDEAVPVVILALKGPGYDKTIGNLEAVRSRGGQIVAVANTSDEDIEALADAIIRVPEVDHLIGPIVSSIPLQLLAYYVADLKGTDVDQPRNLAKSVTVE